MDAPKGSLVAYATAPGSVAADGEGRNGIYTKYLLKYISNPNLKVEEVLKQVRIGVINETNEKQIPWESSSLTGEFYFASKRGITVAKYKPQKVEPTVFSENLESIEPEYVETKEIRYAKSLLKRGKKSKVKAIIDDVIKNSKDETAITEATYYKILWGFTSNEIEEFEKFKAYYPNFRYLNKLEIAVNKREKERERKRLEAERKRKEKERKFEAKYGEVTGRDGTLIAYATRNMTPLLKTTGWYVWSGETKGSSLAWDFRFGSGREYGIGRDASSSLRGFAVRSRR
jgi:hypothetical protein